MPDAQHLETLFQQALEKFPYQLDPTSITQGDFESDRYGVEYGEEFTFEIGQLLDEPLNAGGWIELRQDTDDEAPTISALFGVVRGWDWKTGSILRENEGLLGWYDLETQTWTLDIDTY